MKVFSTGLVLLIGSIIVGVDGCLSDGGGSAKQADEGTSPSTEVKTVYYVCVTLSSKIAYCAAKCPTGYSKAAIDIAFNSSKQCSAALASLSATTPAAATTTTTTAPRTTTTTATTTTSTASTTTPTSTSTTTPTTTTTTTESTTSTSTTTTTTTTPTTTTTTTTAAVILKYELCYKDDDAGLVSCSNVLGSCGRTGWTKVGTQYNTYDACCAGITFFAETSGPGGLKFCTFNLFQ